MHNGQVLEHLLNKYNVPVPRYTSYPTVPMWDADSFSTAAWKSSVENSMLLKENEEGIALYIHLPFCEQLCTFCGCHKVISKSHKVEDPYIMAVLKEWELYLEFLPTQPIIKEIHLGGGSPTFFSPRNLVYLLEGILKKGRLAASPQLSFEGNPRTTSKAHLQSLYNLGFRRVSFGVQDYNEEVQKAINRIQTFKQVEEVTSAAREIGYQSISHDLIYGLPKQNLQSISKTIELTKKLSPERIAFYSYAHVPWLKGNGQRGFDEDDLPKGVQKRNLYLKGKELLLEAAYQDVGMDHFALPDDELFQARKFEKLHRNFMGYTVTKAKLMIGLGVSSISDSWFGFAQNEKSISKYQQLVSENKLPLMKGHILTDNDLILRRQILNLSCHYKTNISDLPMALKREILPDLLNFQEEGLISFQGNNVLISDNGQHFLRNICSVFDFRMKEKNLKAQTFSMSI